MTKLDLFAPFREQYAAEEAEHGGPQYWRSLEHKERTEASRELVEQEFPHGSALPPAWSFEEAAADPSFGMQRRDVLKLMGASMALAGLGTACVRRPEEEILPYTKQPEDVIPGVPSYYATAVPGPDGAVGVLVESHEGRPTKIEGNPDHPSSVGRADLWTQSRILELYDPDRSQKPMQMKPSKAEATWADWDSKIFPELEKAHLQKGGAGLAFLTDASFGPTFERLAGDVKKRFPEARFFHYDPLRADNTAVGTEMVFGAGTRVHYDLSRAQVILALDSNFLVEGPDHLALAAGFAKGRDFDAVPSAKDAAKMNRLYAVEGVFSTTGTNADHRLRVATGEVPAFAKALAQELLSKHGLTLPAAVGDASSLLPALKTGFAASNDKFLPALAKDLANRRGRAVILVGERQPAAVHALAHVLNAALGAFDGPNGVAKVTRAFPAVDQVATPIPTSGEAPAPAAPVEGADAAAAPVPAAPSLPAHEPCIASLTKLIEALHKGSVETLVILGANPAYAAPRALGLVDALGKAKTVVHAGLYLDETAHAAHFHLPLAHFLEAWDDATSWDGTLTVCQPLVEPLFKGRSALEILAQFAGEKTPKGKALVEKTWRTVHRLSDHDWRRLLHDGATQRAHREVVALDGSAALQGAATRVASAVSVLKEEAPSDSNVEVVFTTSATVADGRFANLGWNQELPDPLTKLCWDNALVVGPALAKSLGIGSRVHKNAYQADEVELTVDGQKAKIPVFVLPGLAPRTAYVNLGYGRTHAGFVANGVGVDAWALVPKDGRRFAVGATVSKTGRKVELAGTQDHFSVEGKPIQESDTLSLGDRPLFREASATDYSKNPLFARQGDITALAGGALVEQGSLVDGKKKAPGRPTEGIQLYRLDPKEQPWQYDGQAWGMTIDLTACIGCNACAIACQAENNIPVVGKDSVLFGREMHWIRIDRYFTGDVDEPKAAHQAVPCMQCENAPCEPVCPVAATVHDEEGLNAMVYNRCIGTRYCANNCPFKVRRFNYFDYTHTAHLYVEAPHDERKRLLKMVRNPDVTVRFRGVMEKCTYCTQRVQEAKLSAKREGADHRNLPDGAVTPACAQTCPTGAIAFGNVNGKTKDGKPYEVARRKMSDRNYEMLSELNVRPRTTYLAKLRNTNPELG